MSDSTRPPADPSPAAHGDDGVPSSAHGEPTPTPRAETHEERPASPPGSKTRDAEQPQRTAEPPRTQAPAQGAMHEITEAVDEAVEAGREQIEASLRSARETVGALRRIQSPVLWAAVGAFAAGALTGVATVLRAPWPDVGLHVALYGIFFVYLLLYIKAHQHGAGLRQTLWAAVFTALVAWWAWIVGAWARAPLPVWLTGGNVVVRPAQPALYAVRAALGTAAVLVWIHRIAAWRTRRAARPRKTQ